jgi:excisionase family DNA binding protein
LTLHYKKCIISGKGGEQMKTVSEIAVMFGVKRQTVYTWIQDGLKHKREKVVGRKTRIIINPADVMEYHKSKEVNGGDQ